jgi:hypothetical protein
MVLSPPITPSCGDFEFVWYAELNTTLLYTVEQNFFRIRQYDPSSDRFEEVTHGLINTQLTSTSTNVEILPDLDHLLVYVVTSRVVYRIDMVNGLTRPVILHQTNFIRGTFLVAPAPVLIASGKIFFVGGGINYRPAMLDIGSASMTATSIPALIPGTVQTRAVVSNGKFVFFFPEINQGTSVPVIDANNGNMIRNLSLATDFGVASMPTVHGGYCLQSFCMMASRDTNNRIMFYGVESNGSLTYLGRSASTTIGALTTFHGFHWINDHVYGANNFDGIAYDKLSTILRERNISESRILEYANSFNAQTGDNTTGYGQNPLRMAISERQLILSSSVPSATFSLQVWDAVLNYSFIPKTFNVSMDFAPSLAQLTLIPQTGNELPILRGTTYSTDLLVNSRFQISVSSLSTNATYSLNFTATDGRLGMVSNQISVRYYSDGSVVSITTASSTTGSSTTATGIAVESQDTEILYTDPVEAASTSSAQVDMTTTTSDVVETEGPISEIELSVISLSSTPTPTGKSTSIALRLNTRNTYLAAAALGSTTITLVLTIFYLVNRHFLLKKTGAS